MVEGRLVCAAGGAKTGRSCGPSLGVGGGIDKRETIERTGGISFVLSSVVLFCP